jgi:hypothetical protein
MINRLEENIVHVGLPKTASTFLQEIFFPRTRKYQFITSNIPEGLPVCFNWIYHINRPYNVKKLKKSKNIDEFNGTKLGGKTIENYCTECRNFMLSKHNRLLISSEGFCGISWNPLENSEINLSILHSIFGNFKAIIIVRRQDTFAESMWRQIIFKENRFGQFVDFHDFFPEKYNNIKIFNEYLCSADRLNWNKLVGQYQDKLGVENVLCLPFELFLDQPRLFLKHLMEFMNERVPVDDNPWETIVYGFDSKKYSPPSKQKLLKNIMWMVLNKEFDLITLKTKIGLLVNRLLLKSPHKNSDIVYRPVSRSDKKKILKWHSQSNKYLSRKIDFDLSIYEYY